MRFTRVIMFRDTFVPGYSKEISSRLDDFAAPQYQIEKVGDAVHITANGETNVVPWAAVIGAMLDLRWAQEQRDAAAKIPSIAPKGKR